MTKAQVLTLIDRARDAVAGSTAVEIDAFGITMGLGTEAAPCFDGAILELDCNDGTDLIVRIPASLADRKPTRSKAK